MVDQLLLGENASSEVEDHVFHFALLRMCYKYLEILSSYMEAQ